MNETQTFLAQLAFALGCNLAAATWGDHFGMARHNRILLAVGVGLAAWALTTILVRR